MSTKAECASLGKTCNEIRCLLYVVMAARKQALIFQLSYFCLKLMDVFNIIQKVKRKGKKKEEQATGETVLNNSDLPRTSTQTNPKGWHCSLTLAASASF